MRTSLFFILIVFLVSCNKEKENSLKTIEVKNYNVIVVPDLSNRIDSKVHPKPVHDTVLINSIFDNINYFLKIGNRRTNQQDEYKVDFINRGLLNLNVVTANDLKIDFKKFKNRTLDASEYKRNKLLTDVRNVKTNVSKIYEYSLNNSVGADLWNYFNETIHTSYSDLNSEHTEAQHKYNVKTELNNVVVLFTDGYIENANNTAGYNLTPNKIQTIREEFSKSKSTNLVSFINDHKEFHIKKTDKSLKNLSILVVEMVDRSLTENGVAKYHPTDFQIMKTIWEIWLKDSGSTNVEVHQAFSDKSEMINTLDNFMRKI